MGRRISIAFLISCIFCIEGRSQQDPLLDILTEELNREFAILSKADIPAYYMDYGVNEINTVSISTNLGSLMNSSNSFNRLAKVNMRLGDYKKDNTHEIAGNNMGAGHNFSASSTPIALTNSKEAIQKALWQITHAAYLNTSKQYKKVMSQEADEDSDVPDFSKEAPVRSVEPPLDFDQYIVPSEWEVKLKNLSQVFISDSDIISGQVDLNFTLERKYFTSSEGAYIVQNMTYAYLNIHAQVRSADGDIIPVYKSFFAFKPKDLPKEQKLKEEVIDMVATLEKLKDTPLAEPYTGPALLHARVAGVFFHEIFGHRIEGHRLKSESDGQTFKEKINERVLPKTINIFSDPSMTQYKGQDLIGHYKYDDEGIEAQKVQVVQNGVLKSFLMSRSPLENFETSNGHGRCQAGLNPVARQSNLIIESLEPLSEKKLRKMLIDECIEQGKEYGYYFVDVTGGFTRTDRYNTNSFNIMPTLVYRIYVDKRPDELVRGVDLIGTPLTMFAEITAAGDQKETFTGICGAESGGVPVSATAPALFVKRIETQKKPSATSTDLPLLSRPKGE
ncbi:MAG: metallopeptidase TldD-related protein [Cyclobacteriaceae bacterium]